MSPLSLPTLPELTAKERADTDRIHAGVEELTERLRSMSPVLLDLSIGEPAVGTPHGHTVEDKLELLGLARRMGFRDILLATFDVAPAPSRTRSTAEAMPADEPQVEDDFVRRLVARGEDLTGGFAFTQLGLLDADSAFVPDISMLKTAHFGIPNTIVDLDLSCEHVASDEGSRRHYLARLAASIRWFQENLRGDGGGRPRLYLNYQDLPDAYSEDREWVMQVTKFLAAEPVAAVTFEDARGTLFPFQVGAVTATLRGLLPRDKLLLVHVHSGNGMENAALIEALLRGADGVWAGFVKEAATIGHASSAELLANLARVDNRHVARQYRLDELLPIAHRMTAINTGKATPDDVPILGSNAYRLTLPFFQQRAGRAMDLPPERIGGRYGYRITPVASDATVIAGRLHEVLGLASDTIPRSLLDTMRRLMGQDLRAGVRIAYDEPDQLRELYRRARAQHDGRGGFELAPVPGA